MCALMELRFNANLPCLVNLAFIDAYTFKKKCVSERIPLNEFIQIHHLIK